MSPLLNIVSNSLTQFVSSHPSGEKKFLLFVILICCSGLITSFSYIYIFVWTPKHIPVEVSEQPIAIKVVKNDVETFNSSIKVGVLVPSTTRGIKIKDIKKLSLLDICLRSLKKTVEQIYNYTIYIGVDANDKLLSYQKNVVAFSEPLNVVIVPVKGGGTFKRAVNVIANKAVKDGMDYLVRINDDMKFITNYWTSLGIKVLRNNTPTNVGVVGPTCKQGNTAIMTTDMVHETHYRIFGFYYPPSLDNYWTDDWMTKIYMLYNSKRITTWEVVHVMPYGQRYHVNFKQEARLIKLIEYGKQTITSYINNQTDLVM